MRSQFLTRVGSRLALPPLTETSKLVRRCRQTEKEGASLMRRVRSQSTSLKAKQEKLEEVYAEVAGSGIEDYSLPQSVCTSASSVFHHLLA